MEYYTTSLLLLTILFITIQFSKILFGKSKLPPGPKPWPIIGNILQLGNKPHRMLAELAKIYGPIMSLKLGSKTIIVVSSPEIAKEMTLNYDLALSNRDIPDAVRVESHFKSSIVFLPICPKWRNLRKIATMQLFTNQRLDASQDIRHMKVKELVEHVQQCCDKGLPVDIGKAGFTTSLNLLSNTFFSMDLASHTSSKSQDFKDLVWNLLELCAKPNMSDFFPLVKPLDLQGINKTTQACARKLMKIFEEIIDDRSSKDPTNVKDDVLGILLKLVEKNELSIDDVKHLLVDLFIGGTDTSSTTLEWAMTELLRNPKELQNAKYDLDKIFGKNESIKEFDISRLPYIQAIIKETLRLHPPTPFVVRKGEIDVQLCNFIVPKNSTIWVNLWSIGRNSNVWQNPDSFSPERFLNSEIDYKGRYFEFTPFGTGRRMCPATPLAYRITHLLVATLLHSFNWKYSPQDIDMEEKFGLSVQKSKPLHAIPFSK